uniref:Uncharacterized protein n=1 Tax=Timema cristinae TaxID=61476 RepID=A0A7R9CQB4_TIMCR|nr:unnamed protein product [Timema cristinae]
MVSIPIFTLASFRSSPTTPAAHRLSLHGTLAVPPWYTGCPSTAHRLKNVARERLGTEAGGRAADMEDILIVSSRDSQAAALWVNYLTTCFNQISKQRNRPPFK